MQSAVTLEQLVAESRELYSLPAVAVEVLELTADPEVDLGRLKDCLQRDPALAARLLRVVNSSLFGLSASVSDLGQALALLGVKPLKLLVLGFSLPPRLSSNVEGHVLARYWKHSLTKAVAARELCGAARGVSSDEAFLAALLSHLGELVLIQSLGRPYVQVLDRVQSAHRELASVERHVLGFDHAQLTAQLLASWKFPAVLVEGIAGEAACTAQFPEGARPTPLARVLHLAELMARLLALDQPELLPEVVACGRHEYDLTEAQLYELSGALGATVGQLAEVLGLGLHGTIDYLAVLERAHAQLSRVAAEAALDLVELLGCEEVVQLGARVAAPAAVPAPRPEPRVAAAAPAAAAKVVAAPAAAAADGQLKLHKSLSAAVAACRTARRPLSLLLGAVAPADDLGEDEGLMPLGWVVRFERFCGERPVPAAQWLQLDAARFAVVLPGCDRQQAVGLGHELIRQLRQADLTADAAWTVGVGVASVAELPGATAAQRLVEAAERCLHAARSAGASAVKSIEIL